MSRVDVAIYAPIVGLMGNGDFFFAKKLADYFSKNNQFNAYIITNNKKLCNGDNILVEKEYDKKIKNSAISPYLLFLGPTLSMCKSPDKIFKILKLTMIIIITEYEFSFRPYSSKYEAEARYFKENGYNVELWFTGLSKKQKGIFLYSPLDQVTNLAQGFQDQRLNHIGKLAEKVWLHYATYDTSIDYFRAIKIELKKGGDHDVFLLGTHGEYGPITRFLFGGKKKYYLNYATEKLKKYFKTIEYCDLDNTKNFSISGYGEGKLRLISSRKIPHADFLHIIRIAQPLISVTGDQSFGEAISFDKIMCYEPYVTHKKDFVYSYVSRLQSYLNNNYFLDANKTKKLDRDVIRKMIESSKILLSISPKNDLSTIDFKRAYLCLLENNGIVQDFYRHLKDNFNLYDSLNELEAKLTRTYVFK